MLVCSRRLTISDIDAAGIAYAGRLVCLGMEVLEEGLARVGLDFARLLRRRRHGVPLVHLEADFRRPLRHGDRVACHLVCEGTGARSYTCRVELRKGRSVACTLRYVAAAVDLRAGFASEPLPAAIRAALAKLR